ncbi:hypothetical protein [Parasedimentitalea huanghaiensis]|uniref:Uncharacterized protein n=1 Tax=Parasedimentitalea huanghaiensis TaxID=2682100 RepID=A0A6L6WEV5_9RHOB|nr:hypothetical protein [Zongyanglinia huanghaiensis]MVO16000.1 hypothetical protein [Zongyanglinia huanghaiensis]
MATVNLTRDFADFLRQPIVLRYLDEIGNDAQSAIDIAKSNLAYKGLRHYPPKLITEYKSDLKKLLHAEARFNVEYTKVGSGKAKNLNDFSNTYHTYMLNLEILEGQNGDHSALVEADLGLKLAALFILLNEMSPLGARYKQLNDKTTRLISELRPAIKSSRDKAMKAALTLPLTVLSSVICPQRQLVKLAWKGGLAATQGVINTTYASGGGAKELAAATAPGMTAFNAYETLLNKDFAVFKSLSKTTALLISGIGVGVEVAKVKKLQKEIKTYLVLYKAVTKEFGKQTKGVMELVKKAERAHAQAVRNLGRAGKNTVQRKKLIAEIRAWNK